MAGYLSIIIFCLFSLLSVYFMWDRFSPFDMWIGDFGDDTENPAGYVFYNTGSMITGILLALFYLGLSEWRTDSRIRNFSLGAGILTGGISGILMFLAGYVSTHEQPLHLQLSVLYFALSFFAIMFICLALAGLPLYGEATLCIGVTTLALTLVLAFSYLLDIEPIIAEWFTGFALLTWIGLTARDSFTLSREKDTVKPAVSMQA
ncbi:DUF998 domain-containing protein [Methanocella arvoryzae]|uniref:DUF998 domain-containing protein n=1 Tax=Methanocella arvoryzae TaxID=1175445 RepID=UPI00064EC7CA|nr:hypothetical protein [Methanocella arvoryzae]